MNAFLAEPGFINGVSDAINNIIVAQKKGEIWQFKQSIQTKAYENLRVWYTNNLLKLNRA